MRLVDTMTLRLTSHNEGDIPPYAILSHTWGREEVNFQDIQELATNGIDTYYIDKTSNAELSEAINSMFRSYRSAAICFVYLNDVTCLLVDNPIAGKKILENNIETMQQELIAPHNYRLGTRLGTTIMDMDDSNLAGKFPVLLNKITGIDLGVFHSVATKMKWAAHRRTTRIEDLAYCLMGIFNVNMPLLYKEGSCSFIRLQEEILKANSIFAWRCPENEMF
ncbi:hypothetical protein F5884DRAFT_883688 [Xylogone sp. PMI_703]|nr:hypothetical protein F5884DRAFT_883688 [Xylogone sp. PMI_703]